MARMFALHLTQHLLHKQLSFLPQYKIIYVKHLEPDSYKWGKKKLINSNRRLPLLATNHHFVMGRSLTYLKFYINPDVKVVFSHHRKSN